MIEGMILAAAVAGISALLVMPLAVCEIVRLGRKNRELAERNAVQASMIGLAEIQRHPLVREVVDEERRNHRAAVEAGYADLPAYVEKYGVN